VGIWRNGWVAPNFGFDQGFDLYLRPKMRSRPAELRQSNPSSFRLPGTDHDLTWAAVELLRSVGNQKFFLYAHYMDLHQYVYDDSADFGSGYSDIYDNSIRWVDANIGTLIAVLQEQELMERTIFVVASDHGEAFLEHSREGHAQDLHQESTHVPLVIALPFRLREGIVVETPVENIDIWPTILDLMGLPALPNAEGRSLLPLVEEAARGGGPGPARERPRFAQLDRTWGRRDGEPRPLVSVQEGRYRLFQAVDGKPGAALYDKHIDAGERENIAVHHPDAVKRLQGLVRDYLEAPEPEWGAPMQVPVSDMLLGQLRALGYAVGQDQARDEQPEDAEGTAELVE
jgi:arylsulfatase A-like enzyme